MYPEIWAKATAMKLLHALCKGKPNYEYEVCSQDNPSASHSVLNNVPVQFAWKLWLSQLTLFKKIDVEVALLQQDYY